MAEAQVLFDNMRKNEANLQKSQQRGTDQGRSTDKPEKTQPVVPNQGQDQEYDR